MKRTRRGRHPGNTERCGAVPGTLLHRGPVLPTVSGIVQTAGTASAASGAWGNSFSFILFPLPSTLHQKVWGVAGVQARGVSPNNQVSLFN